MFRGLKGRRVVINTAGEGFRGTVISARWGHIRLSDVEVLEPTGDVGHAEGFVRIPRSLITWIQEL